MIIRYIYTFSFILFLLFSCKNPNINKIEVVNIQLANKINAILSKQFNFPIISVNK